MKQFYRNTGSSVRILQKFCLAMFLGSMFLFLNAELYGQECDNPSVLVLGAASGSTCGTHPLTVENNEFGGGAISVTISTNGSGTLDQEIIDVSPFSFTYNPAVADAGSTVTITVTANNPDQECEVLTSVFLLHVNTVPDTPSASNNGPLCEGETLNLFTSTEIEGIYNWTGPDGFTSTQQNPSIANVTTAASGTYSVTVTVAGCTSNAGTTEVRVNAIPQPPDVKNNSPICEGETLLLAASDVPGGSFYWTGPNGFTSTLQNPVIPNVTTAASGTYSVTVTVDGCTSEPGTTTVLINPIPDTPAPSNNSPLCAGGTLNLTNADVPGGSFYWTGPNGFTSTQQNPSIANVTTAASGTYSVTVTVAGCTSEPGTTSVVINAIPDTPAPSNNSPLCAGGTLNFTTADVPGGSFYWTGPNGFTSTQQNPSIANVTTAASGIYSVTVTVAGCTSEPGTTTVVINAIPATPAPSNNSPLCAGGTLNLATGDVLGGIFNWSGPDGFTSTLQNPVIPNVTTAASGTYSVAVTVDGCTSEPGTTTVVINAIPATPVPSNNSPLCAGGTLNLTTSDVTGGIFNWTGPDGFTSTQQNPSIANVTTAASGTYSVTVTVAGCTSNAGTTSVLINPLPSAITGYNYTAAGSSTTLSNTSPGGSWSSSVPSVAEINPSSGEVRGMTAGTALITYTLPTGCAVSMTFNVLPSGWEFDSENFTHQGRITSSVTIEGTGAESGFLAAFAGNECRGITEAVYNPQSGNYIFELNCFSNTETGDVLVFRYFNPAVVMEYNLDRSVDFSSGMNTGSASAPFPMNIGTDYSVSLSAGWNWFSFNTTLDNMTPQFILEAANSPGDYIKNQTVSATYYEGLGWFGTLDRLDSRELYKIRLQNNSVIHFSGRPVDINAINIPLASGWNWIGYLPRQAMPVNTALQSLSPSDLDYIKDQVSSSTYYADFSLWYGTMDDMEPQRGYMLRVTNPGTLVYPEPEGKGNQMSSGTEQTGAFNPHPYEFSGEVFVRVILDDIPKGSENDTLYAYVGDELRGLTAGMEFLDGTYHFSLMIYSNLVTGETVTFRYYNSDTKKIYNCSETVIFTDDMRLGTAQYPLLMHAYATSVHENIINDPDFRIYPNPSEKFLNIEYTLNEPGDVRITVFDSFGRAVRTLVDQKQQPGSYLYEWNSDLPAGGVYFIKLDGGKRQKIRKIILLGQN